MEVGVSSIPVSEVRIYISINSITGMLIWHAQFYCEEHANIGEAFARFAFCKDEDTLRAAAQRLQGLKKYIKKP